MNMVFAVKLRFEKKYLNGISTVDFVCTQSSDRLRCVPFYTCKIGFQSITGQKPLSHLLSLSAGKQLYHHVNVTILSFSRHMNALVCTLRKYSTGHKSISFLGIYLFSYMQVFLFSCTIQILIFYIVDLFRLSLPSSFQGYINMLLFRIMHPG